MCCFSAHCFYFYIRNNYSYFLLVCCYLYLFCYSFVTRIDYFITFAQNPQTMERKVNEPVRIRFKKLSNGSKSIYLDIYDNGKRKYDFLKLYIKPELTAKDVQDNKATMAMANTIKAQRIVDLQRSYDMFFTKDMQSESFVEYMREQHKRYKDKGGYNFAQSFQSALKHLIAYAGSENISFKRINKRFLLGFIAYLDSVEGRRGRPLSQSSKYTYFNTLVITLNRAVKEGYISKNPAHLILADDKPKNVQGKREFLTFDEVKKLIDTPCENEIVKRAFLFSCFSGLRLSDIRALKWSDISDVGGGRKQVRIVQQKTKRPVDIPLSANALAHLPEQGAGEYVFKLPMTWVVEKYLNMWCKYAGIEKHITYHCSRHTHATLLLTYGVDIYTVSKLLGHTQIKTTEIYADIINEKKMAAVDLIPTL